MSIQEEKPASMPVDKLQALRIDPDRKLPKRSKLATFFTVVTGVIIGLALALALPKPPAKAKDGAVTTDTPGATTADPKSGVAITSTAKTEKPTDVILTATGYVTPRRRVSLSPQVMGQVVWVGIEKGQKVVKDQVLVRLEDNQYRARLAQAEATAAAAKARYESLKAGERTEDISASRAQVTELEALLTQADKSLERMKISVVEMGLETRQRLDDAQGVRDSTAARLAAAKARLEKMEKGARAEDIAAAEAEFHSAEAMAQEARIQMDDTVIRAPGDGTILEKLIEIGELVSPQNFGGTRGARTELLSLADLSDLQVEVDVNESDFEKISLNAPARVTLDAYPSKSYEAYIREIAPEADRQKATIQAKVAIKNADDLVRPEMGARVDFVGVAKDKSK